MSYIQTEEQADIESIRAAFITVGASRVAQARTAGNAAAIAFREGFPSHARLYARDAVTALEEGIKTLSRSHPNASPDGILRALAIETVAENRP